VLPEARKALAAKSDFVPEETKSAGEAKVKVGKKELTGKQVSEQLKKLRAEKRELDRKRKQEAEAREKLEEWCKAEILHDVRVAWGRLGGCTLLHRRGPAYFSELPRRRRRASYLGG
jgi:hypothetical protein